MTRHVPVPPIASPFPASEINELQDIVLVDEGLLYICSLFGANVDWHLLAIIDPASDSLLSLAMHALDHGKPNEPYRTNATEDGNILIYDPETKSLFTASEPLAYEAAVQVYPPAEMEVGDDR